MSNPFDWIVQNRLIASQYPDSDVRLSELRSCGVRTIINLTDRRHDAAALQASGMTEVQLAVPDFTAPLPATLQAAIAAIDEANRRGQVVAVHCQGGLGRTGTVVAAWLVTQGLDADAAIARVRSVRPGSIETPEQEQSVHEFAAAWAKSSPLTPEIP